MEGGAARDFWSHLRLWPVAAAGLALDLWSKHWAFQNLEAHPGAVREIIPHLVSFRRTLNDGALFGLGKGLWPVFVVASLLALGFVWYLFTQSTRTRRSLHVGLAMILAGALGNLYDRAFVLADVVRTGRGTEAGIIVSETADSIFLGPYPETSRDPRFVRRIPRSEIVSIRRQGVVRDFVKVEPQFTIPLGSRSLRVELWPWVFNVADVLLVIGVALLLLNFWWERRWARAQSGRASGKETAANLAETA